MIIKMVTDLCMCVDLPLGKKIVENQDWVGGPSGRWAVMGCGPAFSKTLVEHKSEPILSK